MLVVTVKHVTVVKHSRNLPSRSAELALNVPV